MHSFDFMPGMYKHPTAITLMPAKGLLKCSVSMRIFTFIPQNTQNADANKSKIILFH